MYFTTEKILIIALYHPHWNEINKHDEAFNDLCTFISKFLVNKSNVKIVITGDFNGLVNQCDMLCSFFRLQDAVTFVTRGFRKIDCFLSNIRNITATKHSPIGNSDHCVITCSTKIFNDNKNSYIRVRDYSPANRQIFRNFLSSMSQICEHPDLDVSWNYLINSLDFFHNLCFPKTKIRVYNQQEKPWISNKIRILIKKRDTFYRNNQQNQYKHFKRKVRTQLRRAKSTYFNNLRNVQSKDDWRRIKNYININKPLIRCNFDIESLNNFFSSVYITDDMDVLIPNNYEPNSSIRVKESEISSELCKCVKNGGWPNVQSFILREFGNTLVKPLTKLINNSFTNLKVPSVLKDSRITPVPKVSNPLNKSDYRPVTSISPFLKIIERFVLRDWLKPLIESNSDKFDDQFAFVPINGRGCQSALTFLYTKIVQLIDQKYYVCTILFDLSKAFDTALKSRIILNMQNMRANNNLLQWVDNFLSGRRHKVVINNEESSFTQAISGTPQGSTISPILFAILFSSLNPKNIRNSSYIKYADDLTVIVYSKDINNLESYCKAEIDNVCNWCAKARMKINIAKTKALIHTFGNVTFRPSLCIYDHPIEFCESARVLGIILSENLKWNNHIENILKKASKRVFYLSLLRRSGCHINILRKFYQYYIQNILLYSFCAICNLPKYLFKKINKFERRCFMIMNCRPNSSVDDMSMRICRNFLYSVLSNDDHPFRKLCLKNNNSTRAHGLIVPGGRSQLYVNSFMQFLL